MYTYTFVRLLLIHYHIYNLYMLFSAWQNKAVSSSGYFQALSCINAFIPADYTFRIHFNSATCLSAIFMLLCSIL